MPTAGLHEKFYIACEAGESIKPGAQAPGKPQKKEAQARETGDSAIPPRAVARFAGSKTALS